MCTHCFKRNNFLGNIDYINIFLSEKVKNCIFGGVSKFKISCCFQFFSILGHEILYIDSWEATLLHF